MASARKEKRSFDKLRTSGISSVVIATSAIKAMRAATFDAHPEEACGILLGEGARIIQFIRTANVHAEPQSHFEIDPQALIDAHRAGRKGGPKVLGYFHSHPVGAAAPSATDRAMAAGDGRIWAIAGKGELAFWRDERTGFAALSYVVEER